MQHCGPGARARLAGADRPSSAMVPAREDFWLHATTAACLLVGGGFVQTQVGLVLGGAEAQHDGKRCDGVTDDDDDGGIR